MKNEIEVLYEVNEELEEIIKFRHIKTGLYFSNIKTYKLECLTIRDLSRWFGNFIYTNNKKLAVNMVENRDKNRDFGKQNNEILKKMLESSDRGSFYNYIKNSNFSEDLWNIENTNDYKIETYINHNFTKEFNSFVCETLNKESEKILELYLGTKYLVDFMLNDVACQNGIYGSIINELE